MDLSFPRPCSFCRALLFSVLVLTGVTSEQSALATPGDSETADSIKATDPFLKLARALVTARENNKLVLLIAGDFESRDLRRFEKLTTDSMPNFHHVFEVVRVQCEETRNFVHRETGIGYPVIPRWKIARVARFNCNANDLMDKLPRMEVLPSFFVLNQANEIIDLRGIRNFKPRNRISRRQRVGLREIQGYVAEFQEYIADQYPN